MSSKTPRINNIDAPDLLFGSDDPLPEVISEELTLREYNRRIIVAFLQKHDNNYQTVADKLDISVSTIYRMLKEEKFNNE